MECLKCGERTQVYDTRIDYSDQGYGWVRRRRECVECGLRFKTTEMPDRNLNEMLREPDDAESKD